MNIRRTSILKYAGLTVAALVIVGVGSQYSRFTTTYALAEAIKIPFADNSQALMSALEKCIKECSADDARFARKYFDVISPVIAGEKKFEEQIPALTALLQEIVDLAEKQGDENTIISTYSSVFSYTSTLKNFGQPSAFVDQVETAVNELPQRYPSNAKAHSLLVFSLSINDGTDEQVIVSTHKCLSVEPSNEYCKMLYDIYVEAYTRPRCTGSDISKGFEFYIASQSAEPGYPNPVSDTRETYFLESQPILESRDIESVILAPDDQKRDSLLVVFTEAGKQKLADVTRINLRKTMAVVADGKVLIAPTIFSANKSGRMQISGGFDQPTTRSGQTILEKVCFKTVTPQLPAELKL